MTASARDSTRTSGGRPSSSACSRIKPVAEGVERRDLRVRVAVRDELVDPDRHLVRGLVREGQGEDLRRLGALRRDEPRDPPGDDLRLAGPGAGDDEQRPRRRASPPELVRIEPAEQGIHPVRRAGLDERRIHDRHEVAPGRDLLEWRWAAAPSRADRGTGHGPGSRGAADWSTMGAMCTPSSTAVTPRLSGRRLLDRGGLLLGQRAVRSTPADGLGIDPRARPSVEARQHPAVALRIEQGEREALIAAGVLERVEADEPDALERATGARLESAGRVPARRPPGRARTPARGAPSTSPSSPSSPRVRPRDARVERHDAPRRATRPSSRIRTTAVRATTIGPRFGGDGRVQVDERSSGGGGRRESSSRLLPGTYRGWPTAPRCYPLPLAGRPVTFEPPDHRSRPGGRPRPMAKRVRGSSTRPGQRAGLQRAHAGPAVAVATARHRRRRRR